MNLGPHCCADGLSFSRRDAMRYGLYGLAGLLWGTRLGRAAPAAARPVKAKSIIQIWAWGGPTHLDTFDPKPEAGNDYAGPLNRPIDTKVKGIRIGQLLPQLAKQADKFSILRGMTHGNNGHETAAYLVQTGRNPEDKLVYPSVGAVVSLFKGYGAGYKGLIPPYVVLTQPQGRFSEAGFLGGRYKPFATGGDPNAGRFVVEGVVSANMNDEQQRNRRRLRDELNSLGHALKGSPAMNLLTKSEDAAYDLILGDAGRIFDLNTEKPEIRNKYGRTTFGQSCLIARRLAEKGVPFITINSGGWDTHKDHFPAMNRLLPELDRGVASLLEDLAERGLLDSTIVWWSGEFGRTPKIAWEAPWNGGRHHFGQCFSAIVAGGGFKGGQVVGSSGPKGEEVKDRPVYPTDLIGSMCALMGIDPHAKLPHPRGLDVKITPAEGEGPKTRGLLKEIM